MDFFLSFISGMSMTIAAFVVIIIVGVRKVDKLNEELRDMKNDDEE